jgi:hypothetical protein
MKYGFYSDIDIPRFIHHEPNSAFYSLNSHGYRCPEFPTKSLEGGKNVVVLGCSHTFGIGSSEQELWVNLFEKKLNNDRLRFWNLGQPGASGDLIVRILYATEKILFPNLILVCWPHSSRRERLEHPLPRNLTSNHELLKTETDDTDRQNFLKNVFLVEKFAEHNHGKVFHCFAEDVQPVDDCIVYDSETLKNCWPAYDRPNMENADRLLTNKPSLARDGIHYGVEHHVRFAKQLFKAFGVKFK